MPINNVIKGDLVKLAQSHRYDAIAHCCNCFCVMGAGIAPQIAKAFPVAESADDNTSRGDEGKLGSFSVGFDLDHELWIYNLYGQYGTHGRRQGKPDIDYKAIAEGFTKLNKYIGGEGKLIGIPQLGAGLAGGHWEAIEQIINLTTPDLDIELVIYE